MEIIVGVDNISSRQLINPVATIGNFDGVHLGHQALFQKVKDRAAAIDGQAVLITFEPHPLQVLRPENNLHFITTAKRKLELVAACGMDVTIVIPFNKEFARISAEDFVKDVLVDKIGVKALIVGYDYRFGAGREGDTDFLKERGRQYGFDVDVVQGVQVQGTVVSSTAIRRLIQEGRMQEAGRLLGRPYEIAGTVVKGRSRGASLLGFPTANIRMPPHMSPQCGVYAVRAVVGGETYGGVANLGYNPTFGDTDLSLEVHLFDFDGDLYARDITVRFLERLRSEKRFSGPEELARQIHRDVENAKAVLAVQ